jgi:hypothetical protein
MAYTPANLSLGFDLLGGKYRVWVYQSIDPSGTVVGADYISNAKAAGMQEGDFVFAVETDTDPPTATMAYCSNVTTAGLGTLTAVATAGAPTFTNLTATGNISLGDAITDTISFYGGTGRAQIAGAAQAAITDGSTGTANATTGVAALTATYNSTLLINAFATIVAQTNAIRNALVSLNLIKGAA